MRTHKLGTTQLGFALTIIGFSLLPACKPTVNELVESRKDAQDREASSVPLRVWLVANEPDVDLFRRQWSSDSEQPLEITTYSEDEFLKQEQCDCDVALYPARLVGELTRRNWIVKLPASAAGDDSAGEYPDKQEAQTAPPHWEAQARYRGERIAVPLGATIPLFVANQAFVDNLRDRQSSNDVAPSTDETDEQTGASHATDASVDAPADDNTTWRTVLQVLEGGEAESSRPASTSATPEATIESDREALVDRFLAVAATLTDRNPSYGLLFDMQSMRCRLQQPEFVQAAEILSRLARQGPAGFRSVLGTHQAAWQWLGEQTEPALCVVALSLLEPADWEMESGEVLNIRGLVPAGENSIATTELAPNQRILAWNTGGGMLASLSSRCRQTNQAVAHLRWLSSGQTRRMLASVVPGIDAESIASGFDTPAARAQRKLKERLSSHGAVPLEPRLPLSHRYRATLADALEKMLTNDGLTADETMQQATRAWNEITKQAGTMQQSHYEQSLDLAF